MNKNKYISFKDSNFFGQAFENKYKQYVENQSRTILESLGGKLEPHKVFPTLVKIVGLEGQHKEQLEALAIKTAKQLFPVIDVVGIQIEAELSTEISHNDLSPRGTPDYPTPLPKDNPILHKKVAKQKILNALSQGAAVSMNSIHHMVHEDLDKVSSLLKGNYDVLMKSNEMLYFHADPDMFAEMAIHANRDGAVGGTNKVEFRKHVPFIVAKAVNFVNLVHEIIKGVYTYLTLNAYTSEEEYYDVTQYTDSIYSEIEDIGCGKMLLNLLRDYLIENFEKYYDHPCFFEMFVVALSKLPADEMVSLTESLMNGIPKRNEFEVLARNCYYDLKDFEKKKYND